MRQVTLRYEIYECLRPEAFRTIFAVAQVFCQTGTGVGSAPDERDSRQRRLRAALSHPTHAGPRSGPPAGSRHFESTHFARDLRACAPDSFSRAMSVIGEWSLLSVPHTG